MPDAVHMCIAIPPKHPVASVIVFLKGKSAIAIARLGGKEKNCSGEHFWERGYAVSTVSSWSTAFEAAQLIQPPALRGADSRRAGSDQVNQLVHRNRGVAKVSQKWGCQFIRSLL
jgi:Transposase IS200 like